MKKQTIEIRTRANTIEKIDAYVNGIFAIHKTPLSNGCADSGKVWQITHIPTGLSCGVVVNTRKEAVAKIPEVMEKVNKISDERIVKMINEFNELRGVKTMKKASKETTKTTKTAPKSKKPTSKEIIARLEKENAELKERLKSLEEPEIKGIDVFDVEGYLATRDNEHRITPELIKALEETKGLKISFKGRDNWLVVDGETPEDTKSRKEIFKSMGFRFSGKEKNWFLAPYPLKSPKRYGKNATVNA